MPKSTTHEFMIHYVSGTGHLYDVDIHTHGLNEKNHLELQLVLPFEEEVFGSLLNFLGDRVMKGEDFCKEGCRTDLLRNGYKLWFIEVDNPYFEDDGVEKELRIICSDENNHMPWEEECDENYKGQIADIPEKKIEELLSRYN